VALRLGPSASSPFALLEMNNSSASVLSAEVI
jgi:hypothetical protein